jgi:hypothetical protein
MKIGAYSWTKNPSSQYERMCNLIIQSHKNNTKFKKMVTSCKNGKTQLQMKNNCM